MGNRHHMLEKALNILELISKEETGLTFSDITTELGVAKSSAHSLLFTFEDMGYIYKDPDSGRYKIDLKAFEIGSTFFQSGGLNKYVNDILRELVEEVGETAHLATLSGSEIVYIDKYDCSHAVRMISQVGKRVMAHSTAIGKAILANKLPREIDEIYKEESLPVLTEKTISSKTELVAALQKIRQTGFSTETEESTPGIQCIAVYVENRKIKDNMAISVAVPISRSGGSMEKFKEPLLKAKKRLEEL